MTDSSTDHSKKSNRKRTVSYLQKDSSLNINVYKMWQDTVYYRWLNTERCYFLDYIEEIYRNILDFIYDWLSWLRRRFSSRPEQNHNSPMLSLPSEIVLLIAMMLSPASKAAFALTCHAMLNLLGRDCLLLKRKYRGKLLPGLEIDSPKHFYCHTCVVLHRKRYRPGDSLRNRRCERKVSIPFISSGVSFPFSWIRQTLSRYEYGPSHRISRGIPHAGSILSNSRQCERRESHELRITTEGVILKQTSTVYFDREHPDFKDTKSHHANYYTYHLCPHMSWKRIFNARRLKSKTGIYFKCAGCDTEVMYRLSKGSSRFDYFDVATWTLLGPCGDPSEDRWLAVADLDGDHLLRPFSGYPDKCISVDAASVRASFESSPPLPF